MWHMCTHLLLEQVCTHLLEQLAKGLQEISMRHFALDAQYRAGLECTARTCRTDHIICILQECLEYFEMLTEAEQLEVAHMLKHRLNPDTRDPSGVLIRLIATVRNARRSSGLQRPMQSSNFPARPSFTPNRVLKAQRFSDTLFLYNLPPVGASALSLAPDYEPIRLSHSLLLSKPCF